MTDLSQEHEESDAEVAKFIGRIGMATAAILVSLAWVMSR